MDVHLWRTAVLAAAVQQGSFVFVLALACAGCKSLPADRSARDGSLEAAANDASALPTIEANETLPAELAALESSDWTTLPDWPFSKRDDRDVRWRHADLDPLVHSPPGDRPDLSAALASSRPIVAANAAIVMAQWGAGPPPEKLVAAIRDAELPWALRCAAAEALGLLPQPSVAGALRDLFQQLSADKSCPLEKTPDLHANLLRSLSRHAEPDDEKWFTLALSSRAWQVRYEALSGWSVIALNQDLPLAAVDLRADADPRIRAAALCAIAAHHGPHAIEYLREGLGDRTFDVHLAAIGALGDLSSDDARGLLDKLKGHKFDISRAATVGALAAAGMHAQVEAAAKDASSQVRLAVAQTLAQAGQAKVGNEERSVTASTVVTAQILARDTSAEVQQQAIESLSTWPLDQAGPVLLMALADGGYRARKTAAAQLATRWPTAAGFLAEADAEHRMAAVVELKRQWSEKHGATAAAEADQAEAQPAIAIPKERFQELFERLSSQDATERRQGAAELSVATATVALSPAALDRLAELVESEQDPVVWRSALTAIAGDSRDAAMRMVYTAVGNGSAEVRRGACEYLAAHGDPRHGDVLLGVLQDPDRTVVLAAVRALGAMRTIDDPQPLVRMLVSPDKQLQLEAALSLSRLHLAQGAVALEKLVADPDFELRLRRQSDGRIGGPDVLTALDDLVDRPGRCRASGDGKSVQIADADVGEQEDGTLLSDEEKIGRWQLWYREHQNQEVEKP